MEILLESEDIFKMTLEQQSINGPTYGDFYAPKRGEDFRDERDDDWDTDDEIEGFSAKEVVSV